MSWCDVKCLAFNSLRFLLATLAIWICPVNSTDAEPNANSQVLLSDFPNGWERLWEVKLLAKRPNHFGVVKENGNPVLSVQSATSASGIFRKWRIDPAVSGQISWLWKIRRSLTENRNEKTKKGDDYAARVFVLFEPHFFRWRTPAVCYVWAGNEPVGSVFKSPHTKSVCTIVLRSGDHEVRRWMRERRNYFDDYKKCFGKNPKKISAIALMVDTDNTRAQTTAWFDDLEISSDNIESASK